MDGELHGVQLCQQQRPVRVRLSGGGHVPTGESCNRVYAFI